MHCFSFYIFGYYHYIKQGPTVIGHWSVFKVPFIPLSNLCWESPITNNTTATSKVSTNHVDTDYLARRPWIFCYSSKRLLRRHLRQSILILMGTIPLVILVYTATIFYTSLSDRIYWSFPCAFYKVLEPKCD